MAFGQFELFGENNLKPQSNSIQTKKNLILRQNPIQMTKEELIAKIRELVSNGQIDKALHLLKDHLHQERHQYEDYADTVLQILSRHNQIKEEELKGTISFENARVSYNKITDSLLDVLEALEKGKKSSLTTTPKPFWKKWWSVGAGILLLGIIAILIFQQSKTPVVAAPYQCPYEEADTTFKILVLPFQSLGGELQETHSAILSRLGQLNDQYEIQTINRELIGIDIDDNNHYPNSGKEAEQIGLDCNAQLIIWGSTENLAPGNTITNTQYKFLNLGEKFAFSKLNIKEDEQGTEIETVSSQSSIITEGLLTEDIEQILKLLFGVVASNQGNEEVAIDLLAHTEIDDSAGYLLQKMTLADSYIAVGDEEKAKESYDEVLEVHENYAFALKNRGALYYKEKAYAEAVKDLSKSMETSDADPVTLKTRGSAYFKLNQLDKAKKDLQKVKVMEPNDKQVDKDLKEVNKEITKQKSIQRKAQN